MTEKWQNLTAWTLVTLLVVAGAFIFAVALPVKEARERSEELWNTPDLWPEVEDFWWEGVVPAPPRPLPVEPPPPPELKA